MKQTKEQIKKDVVDQLFWDHRVDASDIMVNFDGNSIILKGTVPSFSAWNAAEYDAWSVKGVNSLRNDLKIKYPPSFKVPTDTEIKENIETSLLLNYNIDSDKIDVSVSGGIVTLEGNVDAFWKKENAESEAQRVSGVISVINKLAIVPTESVIDKDIALDIIDALSRNWRVIVDNINVKVKNGIVELSGKVKNWDTYEAAMDAARYTLGVIDIDDKLIIENL